MKVLDITDLCAEQGLRPRSIALLCALRQEPRTVSVIQASIGDAIESVTRSLLLELRSRQLITFMNGQWSLTYEGVMLCESIGVSVSHSSKQAAIQLITKTR